MARPNSGASRRSRRTFLRQAAAATLAGPVGGRVLDAALAPRPVGGRVAGVRYLGKQFLGSPAGVTGADGATSLVLPDGSSLWVFGDTVEGPFESIRGLDLTTLRSNTGAIVPVQDASQGIRDFRFLAAGPEGRPRQLIPFAGDDPASHRLWAIHGACLGERAYLFYHRITQIEGVDVFENFQLDGMGLARAQAQGLHFSRLAAPDGTTMFWKGDQPSFGVFIQQRDGFIYLWGCLMTGMFLARVAAASIEDLAAYEYLVEAPMVEKPHVEPRWSKTFSPTAVLFDNVPNEMSAAYNHHLRSHVAIHALGRERKIVMRTAPRATGPWSEPEVIYEPPRRGTDELVYAAKEHPELARDGGRRIYVTFVSSAVYVPEMIEVTLR